MSFRVRPLIAADLAPWRRLWDSYNAFYGRSGPTALSESVTAVLWQRLMDDTVPVHGLAAEQDGFVIGIAHHLFHLSTSAVAPSTYLQDLFTVPEARGHGVGRALIEGVKAAAVAAGSHRLYWHTHESNTTAQALYDRLAERSGFIVYRCSV